MVITFSFLLFNLKIGMCLVSETYCSKENYQSSNFIDFVKELLGDVTTANGYNYGTKDNQGYGLHTLKIIGNPLGGYLGVYHSDINDTFCVRLANSSDLLHWNYITTIELNASQPTIAKAPNGAYLIALEKEDSSSHLQVRYYLNITTLITNSPEFIIDLPRNLSQEHEGTPNFYNISINDNVMSAYIGFHYDNTTTNADEVAVGCLTVPLDRPGDWNWEVDIQKEYNNKLRQHYHVKGNIGDRDYGYIFGRTFTVQEGCLAQRNDHWAYWRIFLYDHSKRNFTMLNIKTHYNATSFGNPTFTFLTSPNGKQCIVVTYFIFSEGLPDRLKDKAGELIFYKEFDSYEKTVHFKGNDYSLAVYSNSTVIDFNFNETTRTISFNVSGLECSKGYCIIELQNSLILDLWQGNYTVLFDGQPWPFEDWATSEYTYIYLNYSHTEHEIKIVPELSCIITLALLVGLVILILYKNKRKEIAQAEDKSFLKG